MLVGMRSWARNWFSACSSHRSSRQRSCSCWAHVFLEHRGHEVDFPPTAVDEERGDATSCPLFDAPNTGLGSPDITKNGLEDRGDRKGRADSGRAQEAKTKEKPIWDHHNADGFYINVLLWASLIWFLKNNFLYCEKKKIINSHLNAILKSRWSL